MIKIYGSSDSTQLSEHFNAQEFRCKCGKEHDFEVNEKLVENLEKLYEALNCSKITVTSGYRCASHDKAVGGNGTGQHTKGNNTVTSDFYQYFGIQKETAETIKGIDVSVHNGSIDWKKVKSSLICGLITKNA